MDTITQYENIRKAVLDSWDKLKIERLNSWDCLKNRHYLMFRSVKTDTFEKIMDYFDKTNSQSWGDLIGKQGDKIKYQKGNTTVYEISDERYELKLLKRNLCMSAILENTYDAIIFFTQERISKAHFNLMNIALYFQTAQIYCVNSHYDLFVLHNVNEYVSSKKKYDDFCEHIWEER